MHSGSWVLSEVGGTPWGRESHMGLPICIYSATLLSCDHGEGNNGTIKTMTCMCLHVCSRVCAWVQINAFICILLFGFKVIHDAAVLSPQSVLPASPPLSFYRKLIGSCHWCVKLLCVGHCRQLDYLFFICSILEQLPSALLLFLNEALFPSVALKDVACNCSIHHMVGGFVFHIDGAGQKCLLPFFLVNIKEYYKILM